MKIDNLRKELEGIRSTLNFVSYESDRKAVEMLEAREKIVMDEIEFMVNTGKIAGDIPIKGTKPNFKWLQEVQA